MDLKFGLTMKPQRSRNIDCGAYHVGINNIKNKMVMKTLKDFGLAILLWAVVFGFAILMEGYKR
jgi:hypothetical protein